MEMNQLRYVVAAARTGNFSRAAEQCRVSQPSLSQQIQKLEDELGERLFDRMKRQTKLTSHGEAFLPRAVRILEEAETAIREASEARSLLSGTLTIEKHDGTKRTVHAGQAVAEMVDAAHRGTTGDTPVTLLAFYAGAKGVGLSKAVP